MSSLTITTDGRKQINVTTTPYDGEDFPEAASYPEFVAKWLKGVFPKFSVEVSEGQKSSVFVYADAETADDLGIDAEDLNSQIKSHLWEQFCSHGYLDYATKEK